MNNDREIEQLAESSEENRGRMERWMNWVRSPLSRISRTMLLLGGIVLPILCHAFTLDGLPAGPKWQSGDLRDRLAFILTIRAGLVLYPFMGFAMVTLWLYLFPRSHRRNSFWVQFGVLNGMLVSLWYVGVFVIVLSGQDSFDPATILLTVGSLALLSLIPLVAWLLFAGVKWICMKINQPAYFGGIVLLLLCGAASVCVVGFFAGNGTSRNFARMLSGAFMTPLLLSLVFAPIWSLMAYSFVTLRVLTVERTRRQYSLLQLMGLMTYVAALIAACRTSVRLSLIAYSKLPVNPQGDCYIATAAAQGHRRVVGTLSASRLASESPVNRQLQLLKAFEIALRTLLPSVHRELRRIYDTIGPRMAKRINRAWKADVAYWFLKPAEWIAATILSLLLGRDRSVIDQLYCDTRINLFPSPEYSSAIGR